MAKTILPDSATSHHERELEIEIWRDVWVQYTGTSAQLEAEDLVPVGFDWPRASAHKRWESGGFAYWLRRTRPKGHKGPMRSWLELDSWVLRVEVSGRDYQWQVRRRLARQAEELQAEYYRHSPAGELEWQTDFNRFAAAFRDEQFQAFKALIPGLLPPKRGRKPAQS